MALKIVIQNNGHQHHSKNMEKGQSDSHRNTRQGSHIVANYQSVSLRHVCLKAGTYYTCSRAVNQTTTTQVQSCSG